MKDCVNAKTRFGIADREFQERVSIAVQAAEVLRIALDLLMRDLAHGNQDAVVSCLKKARRRAKSTLNSLHRAGYLRWAEESSPSARTRREA